SSTTWRCPHIALAAIPAYAVCSRLRLGSADSPQHSAESGSLSYGPPVRLRLLSTLPHGNAVTFDYEVMACLDADFHRADEMPSRAHGARPTPGRQWFESRPIQRARFFAILRGGSLGYRAICPLDEAVPTLRCCSSFNSSDESTGFVR